jgi:hypothetical protein
LIFSLISQSVVFAGGIIRKGQTFTAHEDVRWFSMTEARQLLNELSKKDALEAQVTLLKNREQRYEGEIYVLRQAEAARKDAVEACQQAIGIMKEAMAELKDVNKMYKDIVLVQQEALGKQAVQVQQAQRSRRRGNVVSFILGLAAPIGGAFALGRIGQFLKF